MIFIDVDGTLIDEDDKPRPFVVAAAWFAIARKHQVAVWTGGGIEYAERVARRLFPEQDVTPLAKDPLALQYGDMVVDDMLEFVVPDGVRLVTPETFVEWALA